MEIKLDWETGTPIVADLYFIAVELGPYAGVYEIATWDGEKWDHPHPENIIGHVKFVELKSKLRINWPKPEPELPKTSLREEDKGAWEEYIE